MTKLPNEWNKNFQELQNKYFSRDEKALEKMYLLAKEYAKEKILYYCKSKKLSFSPEEIEEKSHVASCYIIEQIIKHNQIWKVNYLSSYLQFGIKKALFSDIKWEQNVTSLENFGDEI